MRIIALDVEGTLVDSIDRHLRTPRPYLRTFLMFCTEYADKVSFMTDVSRDTVIRLLSHLYVRYRIQWLRAKAEYVEWQGVRDLTLCGPLDQVVYVSDADSTDLEDQNHRHVHVPAFHTARDDWRSDVELLNAISKIIGLFNGG